MKFKNIKTNEVKEAYSIDTRDGKVYIKFTVHGKKYTYHEENIEIISSATEQNKTTPLKIYKLIKQCYKCHKDAVIYTYIVFNDGTDENVTFPWDKERLLKHQDIFSHLKDSSIEYYGLKVIGDDEKLDNIIMNNYPDKIKVTYSRTQEKSYPMNLCDHCGAGQGWYYIYRDVSEAIKNMQDILIENA